jgi:peptidoglycan hydrolase CwlO-like protein
MKQDQAYQTKSKWIEFTSNSCNLGYHTTYMMKDRCSNHAGEQDAAQEGRRLQRRTAAAAAAAAAGHTTVAAAAAAKKKKSGSSFNTQQQATSLCAAM